MGDFRMERMRLAQERNWDLWIVKGIKTQLERFERKYSDFPSLFANLQEYLHDLEAVVKTHYHALGVGKK
jgi:hypothetical protein